MADRTSEGVLGHNFATLGHARGYCRKQADKAMAVSPGRGKLFVTGSAQTDFGTIAIKT